MTRVGSATARSVIGQSRVCDCCNRSHPRSASLGNLLVRTAVADMELRNTYRCSLVAYHGHLAHPGCSAVWKPISGPVGTSCQSIFIFPTFKLLQFPRRPVVPPKSCFSGFAPIHRVHSTLVLRLCGKSEG
jgi:hypothetical protein